MWWPWYADLAAVVVVGAEVRFTGIKKNKASKTGNDECNRVLKSCASVKPPQLTHTHICNRELTKRTYETDQKK